MAGRALQGKVTATLTHAGGSLVVYRRECVVELAAFGTKPGAPWNPNIVWAGVSFRAKEPNLVSLINRFVGGEAWICTGNAPTDYGIRTVTGRDGAPGFHIDRFAATDSIGFDGTFDIGLATPSVPAREDMRSRRWGVRARP